MLAKWMSAFIGGASVAVLALAPAAAAAPPPPIFVGGQFIRQHAIEDRHGHLLVPVRGVFEAVGASVVYTPPRIVVVRKNGAVIAGLVVGSRTAVVANRRRYLDVRPVRHGGRVYVPLRSIAEIAGATVVYSSRPRLVDIHVPNIDLTAVRAAHVLPAVTDDEGLPMWAYALVSAVVLAFVLEFGRRIAIVTGWRRSRYPVPARVAPLAVRALQFPYSARARDHHGVGEVGK